MSASPIPELSNDSNTAKWKTFASSERGFSLKYPNDWNFLEPDAAYYPKGLVYWVFFDKQATNPVWPWNIGPWQNGTHIQPGFNIIITKEAQVDLNHTGDSCRNEHEACMFNFKSTKISFNGIPAIITVTDWPTQDIIDNLDNSLDNKPIPYRYITFKKNSLYWTIAYSDTDTKGNQIPEYNQILSTFKFLNQSSNITQDQAVQIVRNIPEVKTWMSQVETGPLHGKAVIVPEYGDKDNVWTIHAYEQLSDHTASFNFFYVDKTTGQVTKEFNY